MAGSPGSKLDLGNIIKRVYDSDNQALKVNAVVENTGGLTDDELRAAPLEVDVIATVPQSIIIDAAEDNIAIKDPVSEETLVVNSGGSINVLGLNQMIPAEFDSFHITAKTMAGDPQTIEYRKGMTVIATLTIAYDIDGDLESVTRS